MSITKQRKPRWKRGSGQTLAAVRLDDPEVLKLIQDRAERERRSAASAAGQTIIEALGDQSR
ncbi:MAG: hypothetical protein JW936_07105 [Sedimentisphaerales bacterium]|nr:hypothetical protein [Sedimentisphaerales bacterium]